jgi:hypothetical protein
VKELQQQQRQQPQQQQQQQQQQPQQQQQQQQRRRRRRRRQQRGGSSVYGRVLARQSRPTVSSVNAMCAVRVYPTEEKRGERTQQIISSIAPSRPLPFRAIVRISIVVLSGTGAAIRLIHRQHLVRASGSGDSGGGSGSSGPCGVLGGR